MAALLNECGTVYYSTIPACVEIIHVNAKLTAGTSYKVVVTTSFGNQYVVYSVAIVGGTIPINLSSDPFTEQLFNQWAGTFTIEVFEVGGCAPLDFTVCTEIYNKIAFDVVKITPTEEPFNLICHCD